MNFKLKPPPADDALRVRWIPDPDIAMPITARLLIDHFRRERAPELYCSVPLIPVTANHMYIRNTHVLTPEMHDFRTMVAYALGPQKRTWRPRGVCTMVAVVESPIWLTKAYTVRSADIDNRVKTALDAVAMAVDASTNGEGMNDKAIWSVHAHKLVSKRVRTRLWLFDAGELVDGCSATE